MPIFSVSSTDPCAFSSFFDKLSGIVAPHKEVILLTIVIVRSISVSDFGIYTLIMTLIASAVAITAFGIPQALIYYIGKKQCWILIVKTLLSLI